MSTPAQVEALLEGPIDLAILRPARHAPRARLEIVRREPLIAVPARRPPPGGPSEVMNALDLADDLLAEPIEVTGGRFAPPDRPGLGIVIDEAKLARYRLDHEREPAVA
jgi:hypothetical protein